jgi:co-chaperonin GroES (HSP10)
MPEIKIDPQSNVLKLGTMEFEAHHDRMIVLQDDFRSGHECPRCMGRDVRNEISVIRCENCKGTGKSVIVKDGKCSQCSGDGIIPCPDCKGKGGTLIVPGSAERRPTTGTIVSAGESVKNYKRGDSIIYPSFSGHAYDMSALDVHGNEVTATIVIMREEDALCHIRGHLELRQVKRSAAMGTAA